MRPLRGLGIALTATMLLAGCGDGDDGGVGATTTTTESSVTTSSVAPTTVPPAASPEQAKAQAAVVALGDLPGGFAEQPTEDAPDHETTWQELLTCLGQDPAAGRVAVATSPSFLQGIGTTVASTVEYKDSEAKANELAALFAGDGFAACAQKAYAADVARNDPPGMSARDIQVAPLDIPGLGESSSAYRATAKMGPGITVTTDFVTVFDGRAVARFGFISPFQPFPPDAQKAAVEKGAGRL